VFWRPGTKIVVVIVVEVLVTVETGVGKVMISLVTVGIMLKQEQAVDRRLAAKILSPIGVASGAFAARFAP